MKTAVIVGAGKGMGNHIAEKFAQNDFKIVLISRSKNSNDEYVENFREKGYEAHGEIADVDDEKSLINALSKYDSVDVLVYNAALMEGGNASSLTSDEMIRHFKTDVVGAQICINQVLPEMKNKKEGCILFTGGLFGVYPNANYEFACMSMNKSALRMHAQMLHDELKDYGITVGIVNIMGNVGENDNFSPANIAETYWKLYSQKNEFEINYE